MSVGLISPYKRFIIGNEEINMDAIITFQEFKQGKQILPTG